MDVVETRELTYFLAVARELHFGRAAERLGIAQPPLSRAISRLERRLGVTLLERTSRRVVLTPAGETLLAEGGAALEAVAAAVRRTRRAGDTGPRLVLALKPGGDGGGLLPAILAAYEREPDAVPVEMLLGYGADRAVREGRADAALLYTPRQDVTGLATEDLLTERQVAVLPRNHRLAGRAEVAMADLEGEARPHAPYGTGPGDGPAISDGGQLMQLIALGRAVAILPASMRGLLREDLTAVPVRDAEPTTLVLAWPETSRSRALAAFVRATAAAAAEATASHLG
ncbi:LysR family transcriptional regulator [Actinomadura madurae]|uniref:LysR family transcriptional regulator n=1 Tax=Actinomadura madurae TaxID=1993 RepID=UPI002025E256|nr:LysR family transcriptional regulator [Actinomadura madurae]MCP9964435.1 LysR family transcriptional regulator [Actinomadura madurae]MCP9976917.1 LysR family transcriptional regulator [Actinomadura madurae]URN04066.1 LysR family transcriptional regulator [Actinomadura madurae]